VTFSLEGSCEVVAFSLAVNWRESTLIALCGILSDFLPGDTRLWLCRLEDIVWSAAII